MGGWRSSPGPAAGSALPSRGRWRGRGHGLGLASRSGDDLGIEDAVARPCDVRRPDQLEALVADVVDRHGGLDVVVVNAGVGAYGPFLELPVEDLEEIVDVNVKGAMNTLRAALPHVVRSDAGDVVMLASEAGAVACRTRPCAARPSSRRSGWRGRWTTSSARSACGARTSARAAWPPTSRWGMVEPPTCRSSRG